MPIEKSYTYKSGKYQQTNTEVCETTFYGYYQKEKIFPIINEINDTLRKTLLNRDVVTLEKICGKPFRIYFDGKKFYIGSEYNLLKITDEYYGIHKIFKNYENCFVKLSELLFLVPFTLFGEIINKKTESEVYYLCLDNQNKLVFHDIFLNDNWMNWQDTKKILIKSDLLFTPELYTGKFNLQKIKVCANGFSKFSSFKNQPIAGVIIRPTLEDEYREDSLVDKRLITKIIAKKFVKKSKNLPVVFNKKSSANVAYEIILKYTDGDQTESYWKSLLTKESILLIKPNLDKILKIIVKDTLEMLNEDIMLEALVSEIDEKNIIDCIEKQLPWRIRKILKI